MGQQNPEICTTCVTASSGGAASMTATIASVAGNYGYLSGFSVSGLGATGASGISVTIGGLLGGTQTYPIQVPAGVTTAITPLIVTFPNAIPTLTKNTAITLTVPSFGSGNTASYCAAWGYYSL